MKYFSFLFLILLFFPLHISAASNWYYPIGQFTTRQSLKSFGQYIDKNFYVGKESVSPNQFIGYHAAVDLEVFPDELNQQVPVYAVGAGKIVYAAPVSGYGGLILLQLSGTGDTALYGHIKLTNFPFKVGQAVSAGTRLTYLGEAFSNETGGERKHLHFGIYKGTDLYFRGYEPTQSALTSRWLNPTDFLNAHSAVDSVSPTVAPTPVINSVSPLSSQPALFTRVFASLLHFFRNLFHSSP
jgi:murein DD-endopeptidase MepM/ murein hydrolase activator NlpD